MLFDHLVLKYAEEVREIYSFFERWQKEGREMLFLFFCRESVGQKTKCAFYFVVGLIICFFGHKGRMEVSDGRM